MYYAVILSSQGQKYCVQKTAHYPLATQTFLLIEKHANIALRWTQTGSSNPEIQLSISDDKEEIKALSLWPKGRDMLAEMRMVELTPAYENVIEGTHTRM